MLIVGGGVANYKNIPISSMADALFNILAEYYVLFLVYPASYGLLSVIDRMCLQTADVVPEKSDKQKKKKGKKEFQSISKFFSKFEKYLNAKE